jgi:hypothetical protein
MTKEQYELDFEECCVIACLMEPILDWKHEERIEELAHSMTEGGKGPIPPEEYEQYKRHLVSVLSKLRSKIGFD